jgi:hypothetical protein
LSSLDTSIFQEAVTIGTTAPELHIFVTDAVAHLFGLMNETQKAWKGFDRWYRTMMDFIIFGPGTEGAEEDPIVVED